MFDEDDRDAPRRQAPHDRHAGLEPAWVETGKPFIEQQHARTGGERARQLDALLLDIGELIEPVVRLEQEVHLAQYPCRFVGGALVRHWVCTKQRAGHDVGDRRHVRRHPHKLKRAVDAPAHALMVRKARHVIALQADGASVGTYGAGDQVEQRCLARAVRTDKAENLAGRDGEREILDGHQSAEGLGQPLHLKQRAHGVSAPLLAIVWRAAPADVPAGPNRPPLIR